MPRYFMSGTPLAQLEREMMTPPGFGCRRIKKDDAEQPLLRISSGTRLKKGTILVWRAETCK